MRAFAQQALLPGSDAIERIEVSTTTRALKANDGMNQATIGPHSGGAMEQITTKRLLNFGPVAGPA